MMLFLWETVFKLLVIIDVDSDVQVYFAHKDTELLDIMTYRS